ncbi:MAG: HD domain-containing protein [bacterium]|nr:HD domain-containing protein [bacterium]
MFPKDRQRERNILTADSSYTRLTVETAQALMAAGCADLNVFLPDNRRGGAVLYTAAGSEVDRPDYSRLRDHGVSMLYVRTDTLQHHSHHLEESLDKLLLSDRLEPIAKAEIAHHVGHTIAQDISLAPDSEQAMARTSRFVDEMVECVLTDQGVAEYVTHMASHHRSTASHMMIVSVLAVMLGAKVYGKDRQSLHNLGMAAMLHDLGKLALDPCLLNKPSKLAPEEMDLIYQHPIESARLTGDPTGLPPVVRRMVLQHHERVDGKGYPLGLTGDQLETGSKILSIVDTYHAITGPRPYRAPLTAVEANRVLDSLSGRQFDPGLLACWSELCATRGIKPPEEWAVHGDNHQEDELSTKHEHRVQSAPKSEHRHRAERLSCDGRIGAACVYAGRLEGLTDAPDKFAGRVQDLSRGGVCLRTDHPLFRGEVIHLLLNSQEQSVWVAGAVAWCRQQRDKTGFLCGIRFSHRVRDEHVGIKTEVEGLGNRIITP